jgi:hypothetical protein
MDFIDYTPLANPSSFPSVSASPSNPKTLHHVHQDITYVNTGSGWSPLCQASSGSVYPAYTAAAPSTQSAILASVVNTAVAPSAAHAAIAKLTAEVSVRGRK